MKKQIIAGIGIIACVALCTAVWPRSAEIGDLLAEPVKTAVNTEIEARSEGTPRIYIAADLLATETKPVAESEPPKTKITAEKEMEKPAPAQTAQQIKSTAASSEPHNGDVCVVDGEKQVYLLGFGWIKDEGGGSVGTTVGNPGDELTDNKVGIMGGSVGSDGDINKQVGIMGSGDEAPANATPIPGTKKYIDGVLHVWVPGFGYVPYSGTNVGIVAEDMYENGNKVGIMGGDECPSSAPTSPPAEQPEITGNVIYTELQPSVTKNSTPPPYKPNGEPINP
ncbi:MAG: hypothetical protein BWY11_00058 [Firmicutes bacterium ADurb.Bin182]|nr:MAG: hypothetical protein BWY11_00058 [Firmicutes bacterium ADurb.Bin182]